MRVIVAKDYDEMSKRAGSIVKDRLAKKPNLVLGLATGSTPVGLYKELIRLHKEEGLSFKDVVTFNLDEYCGLSHDHPQSYHYFMKENLFKDIDIKPENTHIPEGLSKNVEEFCRKYEEEIKKCGGIDLQVLGIGGDGHIAFNEPGSSLSSRTRVKTLDEGTIKDNARFFEREEDVPKIAITMGIGTIMEAKEHLLLINGKNKAEAAAKAIEGPITSQITASVLQNHPKTIAILDEEAASLLERSDYYKFTEEQSGEIS